jgi:hypothetical protein
LGARHGRRHRRARPSCWRSKALVADAGPDGGQFGPVRNLPGPLVGRDKVAAFVASAAPRGRDDPAICEHALNGQPAIVVQDGERARRSRRRSNR